MQRGLTASASATDSGSHSMHYAHQQLSVGGLLTVEAGEWDLTDANVLAGNLTSRVKRFSVLSHSDTSSSYSKSGSLGTTGNVAYQNGSSVASTLRVPSGIEVLGKTDFEAKEVSLTGGKLLLDGEAHFKADQVESHSVAQYSRSNGFGVGVNANDLIGNTGNRAWTQPIPTIGIQHGSQHYQAQQLGTIWSAQSSGIQTGWVGGVLHTTDSNGLSVSLNDKESYQLKIPYYRAGGLTQLEDNLGWAKDRLMTTATTQPIHPEMKELLNVKRVFPSHKEKSFHSKVGIDEDKMADAERIIDEIRELSRRKLSISSRPSLFGRRPIRESDEVEGLAYKWQDNKVAKNWDRKIDSSEQYSFWNDGVVMMRESNNYIRKSLVEFWDETKEDVSELSYGDFAEKKSALFDLGKKVLFIGTLFPLFRGLRFEVAGEGRICSLNNATKYIKTPYGNAIQSGTEEAISARNSVAQGAWLYRGGKLGRSAGPEGQFWSLENPLSFGYAEKYGLPYSNTEFDFVEVAVMKPGSSFVTREAPGIGANEGGGIEVVVNPNEPKLQYFHMPWERKYDSVKQRVISRN